MCSGKMRENNINIQHASGSRPLDYSTDIICRPFSKTAAKSYGLFTFIFVLIVGALVTTRLLDTTTIAASSFAKRITGSETYVYPQDQEQKKKLEFPLNCTILNGQKTCPRSYYPATFNSSEDLDSSSAPTCPEYFRWIHEDLRPWAYSGITLDMVERARPTANFRLIILKGRAYVVTYDKSFQTRDIFTLWGIVQLLRWYPGKVPDLDMMFDCVDWPVIKAKDFTGPEAPMPPPLFRYCSDNQSLDIVFPDWSFWGWPEVNMRPWEPVLADLLEGNKRMEWENREPYAYWKGNPEVADTRKDLLKCNVSEEQDWNARLYAQNWTEAIKEGFKTSDLKGQCVHRYKIYIEGSAWSVSEKYILTCDSVTLLVKPHYYDFFTRGLVPMHHYWPIREDDKCRSVKFAVDWGNSHRLKAQDMGKRASRFIEEELQMKYVYDYMFHLLNQYSKLLRYTPTIPENAVELCSENMACPLEGLPLQKFMIESMVTSPSETTPCRLPPPYDPSSLSSILMRDEKSFSRVESLEKKYWELANQTGQS